MKIDAVETFVVRTDLANPWLFCAIRTDDGLTGYSEFGNGNLWRGLPGLVADLADGILGQDPRPVERLYLDLYRRARPTPGGAMAHAIAGIELALWDLKGKALGVPVYELVGGPFRQRQEVYWSHLATYRAHRPELLGAKPLRTLDDVAECAAEAVAKGYRAMKTNVLFPGEELPSLFQGFAGASDQNAPTSLVRHIVAQISAMRGAVGPDVGIALDLNYHFKTEGVIRIARALEPFELMWVEHDNQDADAMAQIKASTSTPICTGEQLVGVRQYLPYFQRHAMDVVKVDVPWQGFSQAKKVADLAEVYELNIAPHNYNSHLATYQSLHLVAAVSNVQIMESDVDAPPWRDELTTRVPVVEEGTVAIPVEPGWGCDLDEKAAQEHAFTGRAGGTMSTRPPRSSEL